MSDLVKMKAKTTFHNTRVAGGKGGLVEDGDEFETDLMHAKDLHRLGHADPVEGSLDGREDPPLEPHHEVSQRALDADRARRAGAVDQKAGAAGSIAKPARAATGGTGSTGMTGATGATGA